MFKEIEVQKKNQQQKASIYLIAEAAYLGLEDLTQSVLKVRISSERAYQSQDEAESEFWSTVLNKEQRV